MIQTLLGISRTHSCISRDGSYQDRQIFKRKWWSLDDMEKKCTTIEQYGRSLGLPDSERKSNFKLLTETHESSLSDKSLQTLLVEVAVIINSRPLKTDVLNDITSLAPLSLIALLTMKPKVGMPPPGHFISPD